MEMGHKAVQEWRVAMGVSKEPGITWSKSFIESWPHLPLFGRAAVSKLGFSSEHQFLSSIVWLQNVTQVFCFCFFSQWWCLFSSYHTLYCRCENRRFPSVEPVSQNVKSWDSTTCIRIWQLQNPGLNAVSSKTSLGCVIWFRGGDDRGSLKNGAKMYPMAPRSPLNSGTFFLPSHL